MYHPWTLAAVAKHPLVIVGLGREGWSTYQFIRRQLPTSRVMLVDDTPLDKLDKKWSKATAIDTLASFKVSADIDSLPSNSIIIRTPGFPPHHPLLQKNQQPVTSNTQLFFDLINTNQLGLSAAQITVIGVTGTKGKSTTTSLLAHVLADGGLPTHIGGNIGVPPLDLLPELTKTTAHHYVVLELSAHQLADLHSSPQIAVVQNIVPEHLDYYPTFKAYLTAKTQLTRWQTKDSLVVFNPDYATARQLADLSPGKQLPFRIETLNGWLLYHDEPIIKLSDIPLVGEHNLQNVMPAIVIGQHLGLTTAAIARAIASFQPLEHRLELVGDVHDVLYFNDSLSTVPDATMAALRSFSDQPVILLAGGYERHQDFVPLAALIVEMNVKAVLLFPTTGERLGQNITEYQASHPAMPLPTLIKVKTMAEAVKQAAKLAAAGDVVLMSPASPSFGEFKDYQDRGDQFKTAVSALA